MPNYMRIAVELKQMNSLIWHIPSSFVTTFPQVRYHGMLLVVDYLKKKKKMPPVARLTRNKLKMLIVFHVLPYSQVYCTSNSYNVQIQIYTRGSVHAGKHWQACN